MKIKLLPAFVLAAVVLFAGALHAQRSRWSFGISVGTPQAVYVQPSPGPGYYWVQGYWDAYGYWHPGYWAPPAYAPAYGGGVWIRGGYGDHGRHWRGHDHRWDRERWEHR